MEYKNLPNTEKYILNNRNEKLHIRRIFTDNYQQKAIIFSLHGYGSHNNRFIYKKLYDNLSNNGYEFIGLDFHVHGHSDGERALVKDYVHLIDDVLCLLINTFINMSTLNELLQSKGIPTTGILQASYNISNKIPFYIMGHSMGGSIACPII